MRGHITKRSEGSYSIVLDVGTDPATGRRKQQRVTVRGTKKDAEKRLAELFHQLDTGTFTKPSKDTLSDFLSRWLQDYAKPHLTPRAYERYESIIRVHLTPSLGSIPLTEVRPDHIQKHYTAMLNDGLSARTVRYHHVILHVALQSAVKWGLVPRNVADAVDPPRPGHTEMHTWNENEIAQFLDGIKDSQYYTLFYTALFTGMRRSELLGLTWQDIDLLYSVISVNRGLHHLSDGSYVFTEPKSAKSKRTIALPPSAILVLKAHYDNQKLERDMVGKPLSDTDLVFSTIEGKPLRPNTITRAWETLAARYGVKVIRFHDARHTHASIMLKQGIHPKIVQERLGHSSIAVTLDTYSHVAPGLQESAAKRFDEVLSSGYNKHTESTRDQSVTNLADSTLRE